ncbi:hypothetical protein B0H11DRAFT_2191431 [Mycena galericulata]|nr:hypothetical protein B0H11DRAFT_2191431 [Mycena galericulata]
MIGLFFTSASSFGPPRSPLLVPACQNLVTIPILRKELFGVPYLLCCGLSARLWLGPPPLAPACAPLQSAPWVLRVLTGHIIRLLRTFLSSYWCHCPPESLDLCAHSRSVPSLRTTPICLAYVRAYWGTRSALKPILSPHYLSPSSRCIASAPRTHPVPHRQLAEQICPMHPFILSRCFAGSLRLPACRPPRTSLCLHR